MWWVLLGWRGGCMGDVFLDTLVLVFWMGQVSLRLSMLFVLLLVCGLSNYKRYCVDIMFMYTDAIHMVEF
jgi:hypothetical protein